VSGRAGDGADDIAIRLQRIRARALGTVAELRQPCVETGIEDHEQLVGEIARGRPLQRSVEELTPKPVLTLAAIAQEAEDGAAGRGPAEGILRRLHLSGARGRRRRLRHDRSWLRLRGSRPHEGQGEKRPPASRCAEHAVHLGDPGTRMTCRRPSLHVGKGGSEAAAPRNGSVTPLLRHLCSTALTACALLLAVGVSAQETAPEKPQEQDQRSTGLPSAVTWTFNFDAGWGSFGFGNSLYTDPKDPPVPVNLSDQWFEGYVKPALSATYTLRSSSEIYGKVSAAGERTY